MNINEPSRWQVAFSPVNGCVVARHRKLAEAARGAPFQSRFQEQRAMNCRRFECTAMHQKWRISLLQSFDRNRFILLPFTYLHTLEPCCAERL